MSVPVTNPPSSSAPPGLALYAKLVVLATFVLIFIGGQTTTSGAGMAFPGWPLSNGSLNPAGWWENSMMRLEHGHRLTAGLVTTLILILFIWVLRRRSVLPRPAFGLALGSIIGVLVQALLGGLRVILDPQGTAPTTSTIATVFRVLHGCSAQVELCLVVSLAAVLSPVWSQIVVQPSFRKVARLGWITAGIVFLQLIVGATVRHMGAGLAIPSFPFATPQGGFMPKVHNAYIDLNFTHTRFLAAIVAIHVILLARRAIGSGEARLSRPAILLLVLLVAQITLGMCVIWYLRPPFLTTCHVVNGAALLATTVFLAVRASHRAGGSLDDSATHLKGATA